jgi:hypothetical protein
MAGTANMHESVQMIRNPDHGVHYLYTPATYATSERSPYNLKKPTEGGYCFTERLSEYYLKVRLIVK